MKTDLARRAAYQVLFEVETLGAYANLALAQATRERGLGSRDAAFATEIVAGTLRRLGVYDQIIAACLSRPLQRLDPEVLTILRMGAHQCLRMRVPARASVDTSVELAKTMAGRSTAGLVNAVLRRVSRDGWDQWVARLAPADPLAATAFTHAHPTWVTRELLAALEAVGRAEELAALLAADNEPPKVTLVARPGLADPAELCADPRVVAAALAPTAAVLDSGDPSRIPAVAEGRAAVQDEGSQLVALALAEVSLQSEPPDGDGPWLDLCAGPGGKAALLGAIARLRETTVVAIELVPHRARLVEQAVRALPPGSVSVVVGDARDPETVARYRPDTGFTRVLLDAPCSGLGALRRRPEARWRKSPDDVAELAVLQEALLNAALNACAPGGVVAYVTCSPVLAETRGVVEAVLSSCDDVRLLPAHIEGLTDAGGPLRGTIQLWPHRHGTDAMFLALLSPGLSV